MRNSTLLFCRDYGFHTFKVPIVSFLCSSRFGGGGGGAMCFRGLGVPHRKFHQPLHRVAQWLSHVHDEPHQGRMTFKKWFHAGQKVRLSHQALTICPLLTLQMHNKPTTRLPPKFCLGLLCSQIRTIATIDPGRVTIHSQRRPRPAELVQAGVQES